LKEDKNFQVVINLSLVLVLKQKQTLEQDQKHKRELPTLLLYRIVTTRHIKTHYLRKDLEKLKRVHLIKIKEKVHVKVREKKLRIILLNHRLKNLAHCRTFLVKFEKIKKQQRG